LCALCQRDRRITNAETRGHGLNSAGPPDDFDVFVFHAL